MPTKRVLTPRPGADADDDEYDEYDRRKRRQPDYFWLANAACLLSHAISGGGQVVGKISSARTQPLFFYFIRSTASAIFFFMTAMCFQRRSRSLGLAGKDWAQLCLTSVGMFVGQACYIVGLKLSSAIDAAVWQPSQPLFTLVFAIAMGMEVASLRKVSGVLVAIAAVSFLTWSDYIQASQPAQAGQPVHAIFFFNCLGTPVQTLAMKPLLQKYPTDLVLAWCNAIVAIMYMAASIIVSSSPPLLDIMCPPPDQSCGNGFEVDLSAVGGLLYFIVFNGILAYWLNAWASKHVDGSNVSCYAVMQPVTAACLSLLVIFLTDPPHYNLRMPTYVHLIATVGILLGLLLLISDHRSGGRSGSGSNKKPKSS